MRVSNIFVSSLALAIHGSSAQTVYSGDIIDGARVISFLDLNDVPAKAVTRFQLRVGELNGGLPLHLPIFVARGPAETLATGKKLSLSAGIHGDELNGIRVIQRIFSQLEGQVGELNGTVIGVPTVNPMGIYMNQRNFYTSSSSGWLTNVNRVFPGTNSSSGGNNAGVIAYNLWNFIWRNTSNVDVAIDLHTPSTGPESSLWCYADFRTPYVERLAKLLQPNVLKIDPGEPGSIETTFVKHGIPAITVEMAVAKTWIPSIINRTYDFVNRVFVDLHMLPAMNNNSAPYVPDLSDTFIGTTFRDIPSTYGGFIERLVNADEDVKKGQTLAFIRNVWGDIVETIKSPLDARIHQAPIDPSIEPGASVFSLVYNSTDPACKDGCIE